MRRTAEPETVMQIIRRRQLAAGLRRGYLALLVRILVLAAVLWILFAEVFLVMRADGNGMYPAVCAGDLLIVYRLQEEYLPGDAVVVRIDGNRYAVRIAAQENDTVMFDGAGTMTVNGAVRDGTIFYPSNPAENGMQYPYTVPEDSFFVMGDFRTQAEDSRNWGAVPLHRVEGKIITVLRRRGI